MLHCPKGFSGLLSNPDASPTDTLRWPRASFDTPWTRRIAKMSLVSCHCTKNVQGSHRLPSKAMDAGVRPGVSQQRRLHLLVFHDARGPLPHGKPVGDANRLERSARQRDMGYAARRG